MEKENVMCTDNPEVETLEDQEELEAEENAELREEDYEDEALQKNK